MVYNIYAFHLKQPLFITVLEASLLAERVAAIHEIVTTPSRLLALLVRRWPRASGHEPLPVTFLSLRAI